jgi:DNA-binding response OmpR family regulator
MPQNKTVLVLEDEVPLQKAIKAKLSRDGFDVVTARNTSQAMNHLKDVEDIDVIWVDHYLLGQETGLDFVVKLKNDKKWKKMPIFVVSNTASPDKIKAYLALGVSKYYTKSNFRLDEIIIEMKRILKEEK